MILSDLRKLLNIEKDINLIFTNFLIFEIITEDHHP